jgi:adenosylcobyric acid synthase
VVTGLCRWLHRQGVSVAPFKAQNMSLNSYVTDDGGEIGRAQAAQAQAAGIAPEVIMNPVLLKPGSDTRSQVIVLGRAAGELDAAGGWDRKHDLLDVVVAAHRELCQRFDVVLCEGAGSPAEINLRKSDIVNLGFCRAAGVPAVLVGDIDRGGLFASLVGTLAVLDREDQDLVRGFIVNRFRGEPALLEGGLDQLARMTGRPTFGVLPYCRGLGLDAEDSLDLALWDDPAPPLGADVLTVGVVYLPRASNITDFDPLVGEPGVVVRPVYRPEEMSGCDLVILPGTRATVRDLGWLRDRGFGPALARRAAAGQSVLGICGGYQMLGRTIDDEVESATGCVEGFGLLPVRTEFRSDKVVARTHRDLDDGTALDGYEIHHGRVAVEDGVALFADEGCVQGAVAGTVWHGLLENDDWRRRYLAAIAERAGRDFVPDAGNAFADRREARFDALADLVDEYLDTTRLMALLSGSPLPGLPGVTLGLA